MAIAEYLASNAKLTENAARRDPNGLRPLLAAVETAELLADEYYQAIADHVRSIHED